MADYYFTTRRGDLLDVVARFARLHPLVVVAAPESLNLRALPASIVVRDARSQTHLAAHGDLIQLPRAFDTLARRPTVLAVSPYTELTVLGERALLIGQRHVVIVGAAVPGAETVSINDMLSRAYPQPLLGPPRGSDPSIRTASADRSEYERGTVQPAERTSARPIPLPGEAGQTTGSQPALHPTGRLQPQSSPPDKPDLPPVSGAMGGLTERASAIRDDALELGEVDHTLARFTAVHAELLEQEQLRTNRRAKPKPTMQGDETTQLADPFAPPFADAPVSATRSVNSMIVHHGEWRRVSGSLVRGRDYEVVVTIGPHVHSSLLAEPDARFPDERLPTGPLALRVVLTMNGRAPEIAELTLPASGPSSLVRLPITAPDQRCVWTGELVVYYNVVAVHAQQLVLPVATTTRRGLHARLLHRLNRSFDQLGPLTDRTASVLVTDGGARALVNGLTFADNPTWINASAADNAVRAARQLLHDLHLDEHGVCTLNDDYGKDFDDYHEDLANLARHGAVLYDRLFHDNTVFDTLPDLIRHEATARGQPAVLNVADPAIGDPERKHPVPWSLVYDLPISRDPGTSYRLCPSVRRYGPGGDASGVPPHCPEPDHTGNVLCPFGFWGLSSVIEQPPSLVWQVSSAQTPVAVSMAVDPGLDRLLTDRHLSDLTAALPSGTVTTATVSSPVELARMLAGETMDVAYLYCHGGYHRLAADALPTPVLRFGTSMLDPTEIGSWRRSLWPRPHWPHRKPLVVMNGCHTAEMTTATLANFVDAFGNRAGAAGVIGTEVTIEQSMAGWATGLLLARLTDGASAGQALRDMRWTMLARGNVMGLAYTLYAVAGLRLRPHTEGISA